MKKIWSKIKRIMPTKRRWIQLYSALLHNANLKGFATGTFYQGAVKNVCTPGLNCYSCPGASAGCPLGSLQNALFKTDKSMLFYIIGSLLLFGLLFGRMICGFLCPFGFIQDLLYKIKTPKLKKSKVTRILSYLKYAILVFLVILVPVIIDAPGFCKYVCPAGTLGGGVGLMAHSANEHLLADLGFLFTWKFVLLIVILVSVIFIYRAFCRFLCPLGAIYGLFNRFSVFGIKLERSKCIDCGLCHAKCKVDIKHVADHECISCGECVDVCPTGAISWKGSKIFLPPSEIEGLDTAATEEERATLTEAHEVKVKKVKKRNFILKIVAVVLAISVLAGALVYYNFIDKVPEDDFISNIDEGYEVGKRLYEKKLALVGGGSFNPGKNRGRITLVYLWNGEPVGGEDGDPIDHLTDLQSVAMEYEDELSVLVLTSGEETELVRELAAEFTADAPNMLFAMDTEGEYGELLGAGVDGGLSTLIADENCIITKRFSEAQSAVELRVIIDFASIPVGNKVGNRAASATIKIVGNSGFTGESIDPSANNGKIRIVNFWGTWCAGCKEELPYFDRIATEYADSVTVIAIHSISQFTEGSGTDDITASGYINNHYPESNIIFGVDSWNTPGTPSNGEFYFDAMGGIRGQYPHTAILDENGIILYVIPNALSYEQLKAYVDAALGG